MTKKDESDQGLKRRVPRQERSRQKVGLMLEAATRLLEQGDPEAISTNAIAKLAGVSIGTLYQYFPDKESLFEALIEQELGGVSARILEIVQGSSPADAAPGWRVVAMVGAVLDAYGGRGIAHKRLMQYSISRGAAGLLSPLLSQLRASFAQRGVGGPGEGAPLSSADAFVFTHAVNGVLRAAVAATEGEFGTRAELEAALTRLVLSHVAATGGSTPPSVPPQSSPSVTP